MPDFSIAIPLKGIDKVSVAFQSMSKSADKFGAHSTKAFDKASKSGSRFGDIVKGVLTANIIQRGVGLMVSGFKMMIGEASKLENNLSKFETLLKGDSAAAKTMVEQLNILGAETPFEFEDLANATTMLLGFNAATKDNVIPTLRMLGDLSLGNAENLKGVTLAFSQIKAAGKASMQDVNQLINAQVPILATLADQWGVTVGQAREMISKGRATSDEVEKAFIKMTSAGGQFEGGMLRASKTFSGMISTLQDNLKQTAAGIGTALLPAMKEGAVWLTELSSGVLKWIVANKELINQNITGFINGIKTGFTFIKPLLMSAFNLFKHIAESVATMDWQPIIKALKIVADLFKIVIDVIKILWPVAKFVLDGVLFLLNPLLDIIGWVVSKMSKLSGFFSGNKTSTETEKITEKRAPTAPNQREAEARAQNVNFKGELNINGAPQGSTVKSNTRGAPGVNMKLAGQN